MRGDTLTVRVRLALRKRGGRKVVVAPDQAAVPEREPPNWTLVKNLARAFRWRRMIESGEYATISDLSSAEGVTDSYVSRILKLSLVPPSDVDLIVGNARDKHCTCAAASEI